MKPKEKGPVFGPDFSKKETSPFLGPIFPTRVRMALNFDCNAQEFVSVAGHFGRTASIASLLRPGDLECVFIAEQ